MDAGKLRTAPGLDTARMAQQLPRLGDVHIPDMCATTARVCVYAVRD